MTHRAWSLGARLRGQFLLLGLAPVLVLFAAAWALLVPVLTGQAEARNRELALAVRDQVQLQLLLRQRAAGSLADGLRDDPPQAGRLRRSLQALLQRDPFLQAAYVTDANGLVGDAALAPTTGRFAEDMVGLDLSTQAHVVRAREEQAPVWSDTFLSTLTGEVTAALAVPVGARTVVFELSLAALSKSVVELAQPGLSQVVIVDRSGHVIAHPDARRALQQESLSALPFVREALAGTARSARMNGDGAEQLAHALPVAPIGWAVVVSQPVSAVMLPLRELAGAVLAVLLGSVLLAVAAGWRMARHTGIEVAQLADGAQRIAGADACAPDLRFSTSEFNAVWNRLRDLFQQLVARNRELQQFVMVASHDLQEPLRKIEVFGDRLLGELDGRLSAPERDRLDRMRSAAARMRALVDDLLAYSELTSDGVAHESVRLGAVVDGVLDDLEPGIAEAHAEIIVAALPTIRGDPQQLRQLFQNLLGNSLKYRSAERRLRVVIESEVVRASAREPTPCHRIRVRDNGIGFDRAYREKIFVPFQRLHGRQEYAGTGMGLAIVHKIVQRHGGSIQADGTVGEGAEFVIDLPLADGAGPARPGA